MSKSLIRAVLPVILALTSIATIIANRQTAEPQVAQGDTGAVVASYKAVLDRATLGGQPSLLDVPQDRSIFIEPHLTLDFSQPKSSAEQLTRAACSAQATVIAVPTAQRAVLSQRGEFVFTEYTLSVSRFLKGSQVPTAVRYVRPGGELLINGRLVRAQHNMYPPLTIGSEYILFVSPGNGANVFRIPGEDPRTLDSILLSGDRVKGGSKALGELRGGTSTVSSVTRDIIAAQCARTK